MEKRVLGNTELTVSCVGFGAWQLGNEDDWGSMNDTAAIRLVHEAVDGGINLFDTAPNYAGTNSERLLGEALQGKRDKVVLVSKFGHLSDGNRDFSVPRFWRSLEESLVRLRTDHLDVMLLHNPVFEMYEGTDPLWGALEKARQKGKIRHYGASLDLAVEAEACLRNTGSEVLEVLFNIFYQDVRKAFPAVTENGAGIISKVPLDSGWLTGRFDSKSRFHGIRNRWSREDIEKRADLVSHLDWLIEDGSDLAHKAIGYLLSYDEVSCVIPGMRTLEQLKSNLVAGDRLVGQPDRMRLEKFWDEFTDNGENLLPW